MSLVESVAQLLGGRVSLTVLVDRASVEVFGNDGEASITDQIFPGADSTGVELFAEGGSARAIYLTVERLTSVGRQTDEPLQLGAL